MQLTDSNIPVHNCQLSTAQGRYLVYKTFPLPDLSVSLYQYMGQNEMIKIIYDIFVKMPYLCKLCGIICTKAGEIMKKSYKGLILWIILFIIGFTPFMMLDISGVLITRITTNYTCIMIAALAYSIYKFDRVYWYNGVLFEDAEKAGRERRDAYAYKHFEIFAKFAIYFAIFSVISHLYGISIWIDIAVLTVGLIITAISTIKIEL